MRFMISFAVAAILATSAHAEGPGAVPNLAPFSVVELQGDGHIEIRQGPSQQVTLVAGDRWVDSFKVDPAGRLVIKGCKGCGGDYRVTVVTPNLDGLAAIAGGVLTVDKGFAPQATLLLSVTGAGEIQAQDLAADTVVATITGAGKIKTAPRTRLIAQLTGGGEITYTGSPKITSQVVGIGSIERAAD